MRCETIKRIMKVCAIQTGPGTTNKYETIQSLLRLLDEAANSEPDFVLFPELSTTVYWCTGTTDHQYLDLAETIPGPTTEIFGRKAKEYGCHIILGLAEKGTCEGEYYNSAALIGPDGNLIHGMLPDGSRVKCYRKNHLSNIVRKDLVNNEVYFFRAGPGFPIFKTEKAVVGIMICKDRIYCESWRVLCLLGAEVIFMPLSSREGRNWRQQVSSLSEEHQVFTVTSNRSGLVSVACQAVGKTPFFGQSCIADPLGNVIQQGPENVGPALVSTEIDLGQVAEVRRNSPGQYRDRRPEIYWPISKHVTSDLPPFSHNKVRSPT